MEDLSLIFADCLDKILAGSATIDECLAQYPEHSIELKPMLEAAAVIANMDRTDINVVKEKIKSKILGQISESGSTHLFSPNPESTPENGVRWRLESQGETPIDNVRWRLENQRETPENNVKWRFQGAKGNTSAEGNDDTQQFGVTNLPEYREQHADAHTSDSHQKKEGKILPFIRRINTPAVRTYGLRIAAMITLCFALGGGFLHVSADSLPGQPLYQIKLAQENVQMGLTFNKHDQLALKIQFASNRMHEAMKLNSEGNQQLAKRTILVALSDMNAVKQEAEQDPAMSRDSAMMAEITTELSKCDRDLQTINQNGNGGSGSNGGGNNGANGNGGSNPINSCITANIHSCSLTPTIPALSSPTSTQGSILTPEPVLTATPTPPLPVIDPTPTQTPPLIRLTPSPIVTKTPPTTIEPTPTPTEPSNTIHTIIH